ncbi:hypothetical protein ACVWWN_003907 [Mycobacterium sp. URHB0021]|jgi:hypothetical protein
MPFSSQTLTGALCRTKIPSCGALLFTRPLETCLLSLILLGTVSRTFASTTKCRVSMVSNVRYAVDPSPLGL